MLNFTGYGTSVLGYTMQNPIQDILFYFMIYSFIGWIIEGIHSTFTRGYFLKDNFLIGPFKPMYGFAPLILLVCVYPNSSIWFIILISLVVPSLVELISGTLLKGLFGRTWWDYSNVKYNLNGHICLKFSVYWIALCYVLIQFVHPTIYSLYSFIYPIWSNLYLAVLAYIMIDFLYTVVKRRAIHKKSVLAK